MSYLSHAGIVALVESGAIRNVDRDCINAASLDLRLGDEILIESECDRVIDYRARERLSMQTVKLDSERGFVLHPGEVMLAHTLEVCDFPDDLAALFRIKSSMGRVFLEHMDAGWVDPGFNGPLTLEFKNLSQHHAIRLRPGDRIGQLVFLRGDAVSEEQSYRKRGNYNGAAGVKQIGWADAPLRHCAVPGCLGIFPTDWDYCPLCGTDADDWVEWNGGDCPVPADTVVDVRFRGSIEDRRNPAAEWYWPQRGDPSDIIAYRIHRAGGAE